MHVLNGVKVDVQRPKSMRALLVLGVVVLVVAALGPVEDRDARAQTVTPNPALDTRVYYRITNEALGTSFALAGNATELSMPSTQQTPPLGQQWLFSDQGDGSYQLFSLHFAQTRALDSGNDAPAMALPGDYSGQSWRLSPLGGGLYRFTNDFLGGSKSMAVEVARNTRTVVMAPTANVDEQKWRLEALAWYPTVTGLPSLETTLGVNDLPESDTDYTHYLEPSGTIKVVMIFAEFADVPGDAAGTAGVGAHLLGDDPDDVTAVGLFSEQSYGEMSLSVTQKNGWKTLSKNATEYTYLDGNGATQFDFGAFATDAIALWDDDVDYSTYDVVWAVASKTPVIPFSPTLRLSIATDDEVSVNHVITFGIDSYTNRPTNAIHEMGHVFGLPDLYPIAPASGHTIGSWAMMGDIKYASGFIAWHRHKMGWMDPGHSVYLRAGSYVTMLRPRSAACDEDELSQLTDVWTQCNQMIVLPWEVGAPTGPGDDPLTHPKSVLVVELAPPIWNAKDEEFQDQDGVLIYTVDASIRTGQLPVKLEEAKKGKKNSLGPNSMAAWEPVKTFTSDDNCVYITVYREHNGEYLVQAIRNTQLCPDVGGPPVTDNN